MTKKFNQIYIWGMFMIIGYLEFFSIYYSRHNEQTVSFWLIVIGLFLTSITFTHLIRKIEKLEQAIKLLEEIK